MTITKSQNIEILFTEEQISKKVEEIATQIANLNLENTLLIPVLKGSFVFAADLLRALHKLNICPEVDFITISSYGTSVSSGELSLVQEVQVDLVGKDVILVDEILETGKTIKFAKDLLYKKGARQVLIVTLLDKPSTQRVDVTPDIKGFTCPDRFVVGYGIDYAHKFRGLPFIGAIPSE